MLDTRCLFSGAYYPLTVSQLLFFAPAFELPLIRYLLSIARSPLLLTKAFDWVPTFRFTISAN
jgi:hypothetical protein